jgi:hypothetical protein
MSPVSPKAAGSSTTTTAPAAFHYRDFVIKALNADMPYDQFVQWQLAGDEFAPGEPLALSATGFLGAGVFPTQITANEVERTRYDAMDDMLSTTGSAFLGLTVGCARCHDHKFDPISRQGLLPPAQHLHHHRAQRAGPGPGSRRLHAGARIRFEAAQGPLDAALQAYESAGVALSRSTDLDRLGWRPHRQPPPDWQLLAFSNTSLHKAGATFRRLDDGSYRVEGKNGGLRPSTPSPPRLQEASTPCARSAWKRSPDPSDGPGRSRVAPDNGNIGLSRIRVFASPQRVGSKSNEVRIASAPGDVRAEHQQPRGRAQRSTTDPQTGWAVDPQLRNPPRRGVRPSSVLSRWNPSTRASVWFWISSSTPDTTSAVPASR